MLSSFYEKRYKDREKLVAKLYKTNLTQHKIAQKLKISDTLLRNIIKKLKLKREPRLKRHNINRQKLENLIELGIPYETIAKKLNISSSRLRVLRKNYGLFQCDDKKQKAIKKALETRKYNKKHGIKRELAYQSNCLEPYLDEIVDLLKKGMGQKAIAEKYHVSKSTVYNLVCLYKINIPFIPKSHRIDKELTDMFNQGLSCELIAKKLNLTSQTIFLRIHELGLQRSKTDIEINSTFNKNKDLIFQMYNEGKSLKEISTKVGLHPWYLGQKLLHMHYSRNTIEYDSTFKGHDAEIIKMRKSGMTLKEIGSKFGVKDNTVSERFKKIGYALTTLDLRGEKIESNKQSILQQISDGILLRDIAEEMGVSYQTIQYHLKRWKQGRIHAQS